MGVSIVDFTKICHSGFASSVRANTGISLLKLLYEIPAFRFATAGMTKNYL